MHSILENNNTVNIVAAAATGYGNNISPTLKSNNPALKSLSLSNSSSLFKTSSISPKISPKFSNSKLKETDLHYSNDTYTHPTTSGSSSPNYDKENLINNIKKSNSRINYALQLLSDADHYKEDDLECISLRKEAVEILKDYKFYKSQVAQLYQMGLYYVYEKDYQKAFDIFKEAHEYHYPAATFQLARYYESGILESIPKDNKMAQKYYRQAALNSYCKAMYRLSMAYLHGEIGCKKSKKESIRWLHRCTWSIDDKEQIVVGEAMYQLSKFYEKGMTNDKEKDQKSAASYLRMAAEKYCVEAQDYLGYCYQNGHLTYPINLKKALYWYTQAANGHCIESKISLCHLYLTGSLPDVPQDDSEALYWIRRAANSTHVNNCTQKFSRAKAQYILGWFFEEGLENILDKNKKEAIKWYLKAYLEGVPDAKMALKHFSSEEIEEVEEEEKRKNKYGHNSSEDELNGPCNGNNSSDTLIDSDGEEKSDYSFSEYSDNKSSTSDKSSSSLNIKIMNIASSIFNHSHLKNICHRKSSSNMHESEHEHDHDIINEIAFVNENKPSVSSEFVQNVTNSETLKISEINCKAINKKSSDSSNLTTENKSPNDKKNKNKSDKVILKESPSENESLLKPNNIDCPNLEKRIEKATFHNNKIHMEQLNNKINKVNCQKENNEIFLPNKDSDNDNVSVKNESKKLYKDKFKSVDNEDQNPLSKENNVMSEKKKQYISKINSDLVKSMIIAKSEPTSPYLTPFSGISSNSSHHWEDKENIYPTKYLEYMSDRVHNYNSYYSCISDDCSTASSSYCCNSYCNCCHSSKMSNNVSSSSTNIKHMSNTLILKASDSIFGEEYANSNYDTHSQDSSFSSVTSCDKQNLKSHLHYTAQKFAGYDKSQITSSDRMKAYNHYRRVISHRNKIKNLENSSININKSFSSNSKKLVRRHSHSGIPESLVRSHSYSGIPAKSDSTTLLNMEDTSVSSNSFGLTKGSKSSHIPLAQLHISTDEDTLRLHHIKGLDDAESEISYVYPQSSNIFDNFERKEEHHDYGYNNERRQSKPKTVVKSFQHTHHHHYQHNNPNFSSITHSLSLTHGHQEHHYHHHHKRSHSHNHSSHLSSSIFKFKMNHSLAVLSLNHSKSIDTLESGNSNQSLNNNEKKIDDSVKDEDQNLNPSKELSKDKKEQFNEVEIKLKENEDINNNKVKNEINSNKLSQCQNIIVIEKVEENKSEINTNEENNNKNINVKEKKLTKTTNEENYHIKDKKNIFLEIIKLNHNNDDNVNIDKKSTIKEKSINHTNIIPVRLLEKLNKDFPGSLKNKPSNKTDNSQFSPSKLHHLSLFNRLHIHNDKKFIHENNHHFWNKIHGFHHHSNE
ncbi:hypothetical protein U3516DRAFT_872877 [Neocallimastix sp. 'constans']